jgi:DNA-binding transcriptional regulator YiaG
MTSEQAKELTAIYDEAIRKLNELQVEKQHIIKKYIKELEEQKVKALRESLGLSNNQE